MNLKHNEIPSIQINDYTYGQMHIQVNPGEKSYSA